MNFFEKHKTELLIVGGLLTLGILFIVTSKIRIDIMNKLKLEEANPVSKLQFEKLIAAMEAKGYTVTITSLYRSFAKQQELKNENSKNASAGTSAHNYGMAMDINLNKDGKWLSKTSSEQDWINTGVVGIAKGLGLRWGGDAFPTYYDPIHFETTKEGDTTRFLAEAKAKYKDTYLTVEANKITWA